MKKNNFLDKFKKVIWILTPFILLAIIIILLLRHCEPEECFDCDDLEEKIDNIEDDIKGRDCLDCDWENVDDDYKKKDTIIDGEKVIKPIDNCRAHFSGLLISDYYESNWKSEIWVIDESSEYVGEGEYPRAINAFPRAHKATFDGIAIGEGTRVIIYEKPSFKGKILLDKVGPVIITNKIRLEEDERMYEIVTENNNKIFKDDELNTLFPPNKRLMSSTNMFDWSQGSLKVICNE